ncbi:unnamed protein product [Vicia faba]|uniref:Protein kinase domain-containing protein n=1 Tax=Vicia faba TaxID=3906 RepID=A0AAV0Z477_VICFA|nr:unnamed protein product [Vicia faba]
MDPLIRKLRRHLLRCLHRSRSGSVFFVRRISYKEVRKATDSFQRVVYSNSEVSAYAANLGEGCGGVCLVKEVKDFDRGNDESFHKQVQLLGRLHHRHLLSLKGFSLGHDRKSKRLLIFDNIENGSLKEHLNDPLKTPLNWRTRLQIANGVVAALEYLFLFSEPPISHVSISSSNIMLDENFTPKLSDFGLFTGGSSVMMTQDCTGQENRKIIFQLGVLILELVTGQSSEMEELKTLLAVAKLCIKSWDKPSYTIPQLFRYLQKETDIPQH